MVKFNDEHGHGWRDEFSRLTGTKRDDFDKKIISSG